MQSMGDAHMISTHEDIDNILADLPSIAFDSDIHNVDSTAILGAAPQPHSQLSQSSRNPVAPSPRHQIHPPLPYGHIQDKLDITAENKETRKELLRDSIFPNWRDDASSADLDRPDEMQKRDPLGIQIWKLYSKTKTQLPNQERMDNLTWRMMAMNLKRKEREQARCVMTKIILRSCSN